MSLRVLKSGFLATVQDYGRLDQSSAGMSRCGVMDEQAYAWGNYLLNNNFNDACLEIAFGGVELEALDETVVCVTGADLGFKINNEQALTWHSVKVNKGDVLRFDMPKSGIRAYLFVKGGFDTDVLFGSRSVNLRENIGNKLNDHDELRCAEFTQDINQFTPPSYIPNYSQDIILRLLPSYQFNEFSINQRDLFFNQNYKISNASDRTGCRLEGVPIALKKERMISEGMSYGSVEIATDGLPIVLLKDAPTIGGYPKIGTVFSLDLAKLAQRQPGTKLRFELMNISKAQHERAKFNQFFNIVER